MGKTVIYQMLLRLWGGRGQGRFSTVDAASLRYLKELGVTHVWYTGLLRHAVPEGPASDFVKGDIGSPYAVCDYYDTNPYLADSESERMSELEDLINRTHAAGLKVVMDFVPNHVARNYRSDRPFDLGVGDDPSVHWKPENDFYYYPGETLCLPGGSGRWQELPARASGNAFTSSPSRNDWFDTVRLNYCPFHTPTWDKMYDIVRFWASKGVDGFRCDMVEMVPKEFFQWLIAKVKRAFPDLRFIAEAYDRNNYGTLVRETGFDWLYDKSGLYDRLRAVTTGSAGTGELTRNWQELGPLQPAMLHFLENHDEQRVASRFFAGAPEKAYPALTVSALFTDAPFMLYFGQEIGEPGGAEDGRTSIFDRIAVPSLARLYDEIHGVQDALLPAERCVLAHYRDVLQEAHAVFGLPNYDLCWCNKERPGFDPDRHFAFLRGKRVYFCAFDGAPAGMPDLYIP